MGVVALTIAAIVWVRSGGLSHFGNVFIRSAAIVLVVLAVIALIKGFINPGGTGPFSGLHTADTGNRFYSGEHIVLPVACIDAANATTVIEKHCFVIASIFCSGRNSLCSV